MAQNQGAGTAPAQKTETASSKASNREKELQQKLRDAEKKAEALEIKLQSVNRAPAVQQSAEVEAVIQNLQKEIEDMKRNQATAAPVILQDGKRPKYRDVTPDDIQEDTVTFYARCTLKVVSSYMDENGMEKLPPHKIITMNYAASDIRQDGKEQEILNFCSYTTKLKSEIEYLRNHPEYGITITEGMKEAAGHNVKEYQFKTKAAEQVASMSPEAIADYARMMKVPNWMKKSNKELKLIIVEAIVKDYMKQAEELSDELQKRMLANAAKAAENLD